MIETFEAYFDDSGSHSNAPVCVVGGYYGKENSWRKFSKKWQKILSDAEIDQFHAKRFWGRDESGQRLKEYKGWTDAKAELFLNHLLETIAKYHIFPLAYAVEMNSWNTLRVDDKRVLTGGRKVAHKWTRSGCPRKPMFLPFRFAVAKVASYCPDNSRIHFFFGIDDPSLGYALEFFKYLKSNKASYSAKLGTLSGTEILGAGPLQAADLMAYQLNEYAVLRVKTGTAELEFNPVLRKALLRAKTGGDFKIFDKPSLKMVLGKSDRQFQR